jgi:arylsulfatase A-like enzyme
MALALGALVLGPLLFQRGRLEARAAIARIGAWTRRRKVLAAICVVAVAIALAIFGRPHRRAVTVNSTRPSLLIIAVDSLRADRVYAPDASARFPEMAALARRGVRFRQAFVTQARTFPSFVTLLTGRYSCHHGIRHELPPASARAAIGPTLSSVLQAAGYQTAVVSDFSGDLFSRTPLGFTDVDAPEFNLYSIVREQILNAHLNVLPYAASALGEAIFPTMREVAELDDPDLLADRAIARLDRLGGRPFFLTVFFSSPHFPYGAPWPYYQKFTDPEYQGPYRYLKEPLPQLAEVPLQDARQVQALYDGAVAAADHGIARLLARLDEDGLSKNTLVVLLGDHGEDLFEVPGRGMGHGDHLWGSLDHHIPLVIVDPVHHLPPHDVGGIVRDVDLAPTLAPLLGVTAPPSDGIDLAPLTEGTRDSLGLDAYAETGLWLLESGPGYRREDRLPYPNVWTATEAAPDGDLFLNPRWEAVSTFAKDRAITSGSWKLVYQPAPDGAHYRLFDLAADPVERKDVAAAHPNVVTELRDKLTRFIEADGHTRLEPDAHDQ